MIDRKCSRQECGAWYCAHLDRCPLCGAPSGPGNAVRPAARGRACWRAWLARLRCRLFGHAAADAGIGPQGQVYAYCPRCFALGDWAAGEPEQ